MSRSTTEPAPIIRRRRRSPLLFVLAVGATLASPAAGQPYPSRPIKLIVPFPPGGPVDIMARLIGDNLTSSLGQVVVENRPGGGGTVGYKAVINAEPDGYTLHYNGLTALSVIPALSKSFAHDKSFEHDAKNAFTPVALVSSVPFVLTVAPRIPAGSVAELIAYARANPGKLNFGAPVGATPQLVGEMFKQSAGISFVTVPYRGAANSITDMLGGQIDMVFEPTSIVLAHIAGEKVRPLAVTSATRSPYLPDLPTLIESGLPGVVAVSRTGIVAPAGTPPAIVATLNRAINVALRAGDMRAALQKLGGEPVGGSPQDFAAALTEEAPKWIATAQSAGWKID
jgi:tripartite-type tricarboxylate transporter receptor subunit TctC